MELFNAHMPSLDIIFGPMFSGKTTELIRRLSIFDKLKLRVLYINYAGDDRSDKDFSTHNETITTLSSGIKSMKSLRLSDIDVNEYDVIGVDEAQFFSDLDSFAWTVVEHLKKKLVVAGLNGDFKRRPFGKLIDLIPLCDNVTKLFPFCVECMEKNRVCQPALFSKRKSKENENDILIGGQESYIPACRECYLSK